MAQRRQRCAQWKGKTVNHSVMDANRRWGKAGRTFGIAKQSALYAVNCPRRPRRQ